MLKGLVLCFAFLIVQLGVLHMVDKRVAASEREVHYAATPDATKTKRHRRDDEADPVT